MKDPRLSHVNSNKNLGDDVTLSSLQENPFAEYMWMEHEEEFNRQVEEELWEEDFMERCFQEMLDEEEWEWFVPSRDLPPGNQLHGHTATSSNLNPHAKEFTPGIQKHVM
ncbi:polyadenylate-binding protein-interacting protein 2-like [Entelurus aequoreus]|uniref:polyadenylate-binding protein-interacting protein 2-like n=1 Tax=Entelurus aequoreus TaxID=161455 RepID=UPI002B1E7EE3|nr:polyadenylate-binding protein-interacting protein 2-like [Entelurus aequoreus]